MFKYKIHKGIKDMERSVVIEEFTSDGALQLGLTISKTKIVRLDTKLIYFD